MHEIISTYAGESIDGEINCSPGIDATPLRCSEIMLASHSLLRTGNSCDGNVLSSPMGYVVVPAGILIEFFMLDWAASSSTMYFSVSLVDLLLQLRWAGAHVFV